ncbi:MAG: hypothetical protein RR336_05815 [Oscillospiraceae bacterium]
MNIDGTIKMVSDLSETVLSTGDIIAIVVSSISLIGVLISTYWTNITTKKINRSNNAMQDKWNQKTIDANLIATARIEWIQNVRKITADLLTSYFSILNTADVEVVQINFYDAIKETELLILYFGHEKISSSSDDLSPTLDKESNDGKNELIVSFLVLLSEKFREYYSDIKKGEVKRLEEALKQAKDAMYSNAIWMKTGESYNELAEEIEDIMEPIPQEEDIQYAASLEARYQNKVKQITELQKDLVLLRNIIRIYLKIEWNKSKTGS